MESTTNRLDFVQVSSASILHFSPSNRLVWFYLWEINYLKETKFTSLIAVIN